MEIRLFDDFNAFEEFWYGMMICLSTAVECYSIFFLQTVEEQAF